MTWLEATARWYGLLVLISIAWAPWIRLLCPRLADRGASIGRPVALLAFIYPAWLLAYTGLLPYSNALLWATIAVAGVAGWGIVFRRGLIDRGWLLALAVVEVVAAASFAGFVWLRGFTPAILFTEKPMESAFLMSSTLATTMPPGDPWFSGEPINYYYLGYVVHGTVSRLADVAGTTGFNLALATTFSMAVTAAAGLGWNIVRRWYSPRLALVAAAIAVVAIMFAGNLYAAGQIAQTRDETLAASWWDKQAGVGWRASRIVCDTERVNNDCEFPHETINEFPSFSFILGDLHPHVLALPYALAALLLAFNLLAQSDAQQNDVQNRQLTWARALRLGATGAIVGSLYALNSWDLPIYLLLAGFAAWWANGRTWRPVLLLVASAALAWAPFYLGYAAPTGSGAAALPEQFRDLPVVARLLGTIAIHTGERTSAAEFLTIFGLPYVFSLWLLGSGLLHAGRSRSPVVLSPMIAVLVIITTLVAILIPAPLILLCGVPLVAAAFLLRREPQLSVRSIVTVLYGAGFVLLIGTEFVFIQDVFGTRMNTLFKFYYQVWVLFGVATALSVAVIWTENRVARLSRPALIGLTVAGLIAGLFYPALSARAWTDQFQSWSGLDGIAYVADFSADELAAIRWLQANVRHTDVLLEAAGCSYEVNGGIPLNRASAFSGVPTVIGWSGHERQWRSGQTDLLDEINQREADVAEMYANPSSDRFDRYGITLLYLGQYERGEWQHLCPAAGPYPGVEDAGYPGPGWELVFSQGEVTIFRRTDSGTATAGD